MSGGFGRPAFQAVALLLCLLATVRAQIEGSLEVEPVRVVSRLEGDWGYLAVRPVHAEMFAWMADAADGASTDTIARMQDAATSGTLPRALAALVASRETGTSVTLGPARRDELTSAALAVLRDRDLGWGAGPLAAAAIESSNGAGFAHRLMDQFGEDAVKHNATRGADLFRLGLVAGVPTFRAALLERWARTPGPREYEPESQERVILASLLLSLAVDADGDFADPAHTWLSLALTPPGPALPARWDRLSPAERAAALDAARAFAGRRWTLDPTATEVAAHARDRSWVLLELAEPLPAEELLAVLSDPREEGYDRYHAACVIAVRDPSLLATARGSEALASLAVEDYWRTPRVAMLLGESAGRANPDGREWCGEGSVAADTLVTAARTVAVDAATAGTTLDRLEADFTRRLERETRPRAQIGLWNFLLATGGRDASLAISNAAISNLVADDECGNASEARWALRRLGPEAVSAAEAGLRVAEEVGDWQLADLCSDFLREKSPGCELPVQPRLAEFMVLQLADDGTEGNAACAVRYLARCGDWADEAIRRAAEHGDWQQRLHASRLLESRR